LNAKHAFISACHLPVIILLVYLKIEGEFLKEENYLLSKNHTVIKGLEECLK